MVTVVEVDLPRKRIGLSMKADPFANIQPETTVKATVPAKPKKFKAKGPEKPKEKELSMEEKLALLVNKFKK